MIRAATYSDTQPGSNEYIELMLREDGIDSYAQKRYGGLHQKSCTCAKTLGMLGIFEISTKTLYSLIF